MTKINEVSTREFSDRYETKLKLKCRTFRPTPFEIDIRNIEIKITDVIKILITKIILTLLIKLNMVIIVP